MLMGLKIEKPVKYLGGRSHQLDIYIYIEGNANECPKDTH